ncbi:MAG TPA: carboxypeptidase-like regulatory domain-containing protein [Terracidiphilus sp.]|jgi:hypothetical protein|nr:carboxypeptidase-like regulatory domain-containing protein [Terracidiphilus sp.]
MAVLPQVQAQPPSIAAAPALALPDAPQPQTPQPQNDSAQNANAASPSAGATLSGTVLDTNGDVVQGARVAVRRPSGASAQIVQSGSDGQFTFNNLPPGPYKLTVTAKDMGAYASAVISLQTGDVRILPKIVLSVAAASTSITVIGDKEELAEEQVQIAVQQRVLGVIPNFYMTFDWNAPPMLARQKFQLSFRSMFDPTAFAVMAGIAGAEQYKDVYPGFGGGLSGYGKRYGATFANHVSGQLFGRAIYPALFRQDPRYFYKGKGSVRSRALYAMSAAVIARGDDGRWRPNYSNVLGDLTAGAISNLYFPSSERGASLVFFNGLTEIGAGAVENILKEFLLKDMTSHIPRGANGQP